MTTKYTPEQIELFNKMFSIRVEYDMYFETKLTSEGLIEEDESVDSSYNTECADIELSNGTIYEIY